ncbi:MAG TPA: hypothetical protein VKA26_13195 [Ignavibacteriaceae bacterium]|nr:hypothetical protein [Ignavibacteriaceae bacterium]
MKNIIFISLVTLFIGSCSSSYFDSNIKTNYPEGLELYKSKCSGCHRLHLRNEFSASGWASVLIPMQKKAKINDEQRKKIYQFLTERDSTLL